MICWYSSNRVSHADDFRKNNYRITPAFADVLFYSKLAKYAQEATSIPAATFLHELAKYRDDVIAEWKFAARRRTH